MVHHDAHGPSAAEEEGTAPLPLRHVEELINTRSLVFGTDRLNSPADLARWLRARDLVPAGTRGSRQALASAVRLREGLRALLVGNNTAAAPEAPADTEPDALADLAALARDLPLVLDPAARPPRLTARDGATPDGALAGLLAAVAHASATGEWNRLKVCRKPGCRWAYYDHSRNRARAWCSMETCGNQAKVHAFRTRQSTR